ncbi:MAG: methyltransferase domain-containing protein [Azospirillaceae bacterium]|nr:methyltransferase domain-containing protein [Azospirillaceae bacterium]
MTDADTMTVFDRRLHRRRRDRSAPTWTQFDFLFRDVAERLDERLDDIRRRFPVALDLSCRGGALGAHLRRRPGLTTLYGCELSPALARQAAATGCYDAVVAADEEALPFGTAGLDLIISNLGLHWTNDLPGALIQACHALRPDGFFLAAMFGGDSLIELRHCLMDAEIAVLGGVSPRISPFAGVRDAGALLQRAGFALPVVDSDTLTVTYDNPFRLFADLRGMGETNSVLDRRKVPAPRALFVEAARLYAERYAGPDGRIPATVQVIYLAGWAPHASQQRPLKPGSAQFRLEDALNPAAVPGSRPGSDV